MIDEALAALAIAYACFALVAVLLRDHLAPKDNCISLVCPHHGARNRAQVDRINHDTRNGPTRPPMK